MTREGAGPEGIWAARRLGGAGIQQAGSKEEVLKPSHKEKPGAPKSREILVAQWNARPGLSLGVFVGGGAPMGADRES